MSLTERQQQAKDRHIQRKYAKDLIQPSEDRFKLYYPKQYGSMEKTRERQEIKKSGDKKSKDNFFKKYKTSIHSDEMRNTLKLEDKLDEKLNGRN